MRKSRGKKATKLFGRFHAFANIHWFGKMVDSQKILYAQKMGMDEEK